MSTQTRNQSVRLTQSLVDKLTPPARGQTFIRDTTLTGFGVRVTASGAKAYILERRINRKVRRITLGRCGELNVGQARRKAMQLTGQIAMGIDPVAAERSELARAVSLGEAHQDFLKVRELRPQTRLEYERIFKRIFADWQGKRLVDITRPMVLKRHQSLKRTPAQANLALRYLRAVLNHAKAAYRGPGDAPLLLENPVEVLTETRSWYRIPRRQTVIKALDMPRWYQAVEGLRGRPEPSSAVGADFLLLLLFTGLRCSEALRLTWADVDFRGRTLLIPETKNHRPALLPVTDAVEGILERLSAAAFNQWVFPSPTGQGHLGEHKKIVQRVVEASGIPFTLHDLRRTYVTTASICDVSHYTIKRLVNHKISSDVTDGYIVADVERLRKPAQTVADQLQRLISGKTATVSPFPDRKARQPA